ncbi:hypothetical protein GCM10011351_00930 [Paraliobacillus quinghaiensis]|uniref:Uncharacterized protein n=1 Tax=Paraliobacillus quinghaiensis TaxID=470815 RepID=A0A917TDM1_9BACI|nr:hypothetical protein [Paraliobacillus quinghaiensis]GGM18974.1 hypothetical protein GCM10011351_00930 [Paraliobacillus quinghaiensis]
MNHIIISLSLLGSTVLSVSILKKKNNKLLSMLSAFCFNLVFLILMMWILMDDEARTFGHSHLHNLVFAVPLITWINFIILQFVIIKEVKA